ncbi:hypothetical protein [Rathayibacter sp. VKM Ac-2760]|uniref:hypothetical protein n=1 Tax=Rathayibacter sp. VKM Ac-2760 TaxID=2609253 RepID=UPI0013190348|nr:hypothetical protein [Rathayibacter sp. VKM Ac-2760]QHC57375.1 hypothetical protein GSU72_01360 [Rathayibacter sp. VKM Ac-2760]
MFEPEGSVRPFARIMSVTAALLVGAVLVGGAVGAAVALSLYLPSALAAGALDPSALVSFGMLMGTASGAALGAVGGIGAIAGMVAVRAVSRRDSAFVAGTSVGAASGVLILAANLLVSRDAATWISALLATAAAFALCAWGSWLLTRHEHSWERAHALQRTRPAGRARPAERRAGPAPRRPAPTPPGLTPAPPEARLT